MSLAVRGSAEFVDRVVRRKEAAHLLGVKERAFDEQHRPYLAFVPIGGWAGKRTVKGWLLSDIQARQQSLRRPPEG